MKSNASRMGQSKARLYYYWIDWKFHATTYLLICVSHMYLSIYIYSLYKCEQHAHISSNRMPPHV